MKRIHVISEVDVCNEVDLLNKISTNIHFVFHKISFPDHLKFSEKGYYEVDSLVESYSNLVNKTKNVIIFTDNIVKNDCHLISQYGSVVISTFSILSNIFDLKAQAALILFGGILLKEQHSSYQIQNSSTGFEQEFFTKLARDIFGATKVDYSEQFSRIYNDLLQVEKHFVLISHGINTHAFWAERVKKELEKHGFECEILRPELTTPIRFYLCLGRCDIANELLTKLLAIQREKPEHKVSIITHSYGTFLLSRALMTAKNMHCALNINTIRASCKIEKAAITNITL